MGKASKWIKNLLTGKKKSSSHQPVSAETIEYPKTPISLPPGSSKDKRRWSFRKSSAFETHPKDVNVVDITADMRVALEDLNEQKTHVMTVAVANTAAADAAAQLANEDAMRLTCSAPRMASSVGDIAAAKIQSVFRSYLARKALFALKGLVKLQAMVRGHLVRRQATATVRCMQALLTVQARARVRRINMINEPNPYNQRQSVYTEPTTDERFTYPVHDPQTDHIKIVEMDTGHTRGNTKSRVRYFSDKQTDNIYSQQYSKHHHHISPAPSAVTNMSPRSYSGHFDELFQSPTHSNPRHHPAMDKPDMSKVHFSYKKENAEDKSYEHHYFPNYMANTKSSKAKYRSHSAPKQRPADSYQHQPSKQRVSIEGRNVPRAVRMERSSSVYCSTQNYQYPWSLELDESAPSIKDSECGSNSSMRTNYYYCRALAGFKVQEHGY